MGNESTGIPTNKQDTRARIVVTSELVRPGDADRDRKSNRLPQIVAASDYGLTDESRNRFTIPTIHSVRVIIAMWSVPGRIASCACGINRDNSTACSGRTTSASPHRTRVGAL